MPKLLSKNSGQNEFIQGDIRIVRLEGGSYDAIIATHSCFTSFK